MKKYKTNFLLSPTTEIFSGTIDPQTKLASAQYVEYIRYTNVISAQNIPGLHGDLVGTILKYK